jgi:hypothetical protein
MGLANSGTGQASAPAVESRPNRRLHERIPINRQVYLCWQDRQTDQVQTGRAIDISKFGMLVEADRPIQPGTTITVQTNSTMLGSACVRHCTPSGYKYKIGLHMPDRTARDL